MQVLSNSEIIYKLQKLWREPVGGGRRYEILYGLAGPKEILNATDSPEEAIAMGNAYRDRAGRASSKPTYLRRCAMAVRDKETGNIIKKWEPDNGSSGGDNKPEDKKTSK